MIRRPDEYAHQNDSLAIVDESNVRGGRRVVQNLQELYGLYAYQDKLKDNVTIVRVISEDKDYRLVNKSLSNTANGWISDSVSSPPEIQVSTDQPTDSNIKLWGKIITVSDLAILKQIRDLNPNSQLPNLWLDSADPYSGWSGVSWSGTNLTTLSIGNAEVQNVSKINKLISLNTLILASNNISSLNISNLTNLTYLETSSTLIESLDLTSNTNIQTLYGGFGRLNSITFPFHNNLVTLDLRNNFLTNVSWLTSKGSITYANFSDNKFSQQEVDRLLSIGFTQQQIGVQNP